MPEGNMKKYTIQVDGHIYLDIKVQANSLEHALSKIESDGANYKGINLSNYLKSNVIWQDGAVYINGVWETNIIDCRRG